MNPYDADGKWHPLPHDLDAPLRWRIPRRVRVATDLFHEDVPDDFIAQVFGVMARCPQHTFQVLTKRPERMAKLLGGAWIACEAENYSHDGDDLIYDRMAWPLPNVWLGVSVEDQPTADLRVPHLLATPAAVRFLSCEPLLGPLSVGPYLLRRRTRGVVREDGSVGSETARIDWLILGGESGPGARPMDLAWARSIVEQGRAASVPVFVKQLGANAGVECPTCSGLGVREADEGLGCAACDDMGFLLVQTTHRAGGDPDEWPPDLRVRECPAGANDTIRTIYA